MPKKYPVQKVLMLSSPAGAAVDHLAASKDISHAAALRVLVHIGLRTSGYPDVPMSDTVTS